MLKLKLPKDLYTNPFKFIPLFFFISLFASLAFGQLLSLLEILFNYKATLKNEIANMDLWEQFILACIVAPLIETYFLQHIPYNFLSKKRVPFYLILPISALLFGAMHYQSIDYIFYGVMVGCILITAYHLWQGKKINKFYMVSIIHAIWNLFVFLVHNFT